MKPNFKIKTIFTFFAFNLLIFNACNKENNSENFLLKQKDMEEEPNEEMTILGEQCPNPYSVENMTIAYDSLVADGVFDIGEDPSYILTPTHLYVRFLPDDSTEFNTLIDDTTLELFDYPLDYEIEQRGLYYHDPTISEDECTWLYTVVPINFSFPTNIPYQILDSCIIPEENTPYYYYHDKMEEKSCWLFQPDLMEDDEQKSTNKATPEGTINVLRNNNWTGVEKTKVRVNNFVKIASGWTTESGYYIVNKSFYVKKVDYTVVFENQLGFKIWGNWGFINPATYNIGKYSKNGCNKYFNYTSVGWNWATINNAVYKYFQYCSSKSITRPPSDLRIWVTTSNNISGTMGSAAMLRRTWGWYGFNNHSQISTFILNKNGILYGINILAKITKFAQPDLTITIRNGYTNYNHIFQTTFHECAHASHWQKVGSAYWVNYINYIITYGAYGDGTGANAGYCGVGEMWGNYVGALFRKEYFNEAGWSFFNHDEDWYNPGFLRKVDSIPDISLSDIYNCLTPTTTTFSELITQLKARTIHDNDIDSAFIFYKDWP
ncbi:MAG TPA: hypothetical protein PLP76_03470 [Bacteroidales bacterium]|nr:hypothetical protein [Bacteroidales bacterium]HPJ90555.1 hypothetical protein [Bacteroidales bacterium]